MRGGHSIIMVTGATGFIGRALVEQLSRDASSTVRAVVRRENTRLPLGVELIRQSNEFGASLEPTHFAGVRAIVHCAARVHVMKDSSRDPLAAFRAVNVEATLALARQAAKAGVSRFVFLSSIKVNGESTRPGVPFTASDEPCPADAYGVSKLEAEEGLRCIAKETGLEVVCIRPVLVYGPRVKANFRSLMSALSRRIPLPLGAINNRRSLLARDNLIDLLKLCISHPAAANQVFLASDGEDLSTTQLASRLAAALDCKAWLLPVPASWLLAAARLVGKQAVAQRLCDSLQVDIAKNSELLGWRPPVPVNTALQAAAKDFLKHG